MRQETAANRPGCGGGGRAGGALGVGSERGRDGERARKGKETETEAGRDGDREGETQGRVRKDGEKLKGREQEGKREEGAWR